MSLDLAQHASSPWGKMLLPLQFSGLHKVCSVAQQSLLQLLLGPNANSGSVRGGIHALWLLFCLAVAAARQPHPHIYTPSLPRSLGADKVCADLSGRDASSTSLLSRMQTATWFLSFPKPCIDHWAASAAPGSALYPSLLLLVPIFPSPDVSMYRSFRCLCIVQGILCWIMIVKTIVTPGTETRGASHTTMLLMSKLINYLIGTRNLI